MGIVVAFLFGGQCRTYDFLDVRLNIDQVKTARYAWNQGKLSAKVEVPYGEDSIPREFALDWRACIRIQRMSFV